MKNQRSRSLNIPLSKDWRNKMQEHRERSATDPTKNKDSHPYSIPQFPQSLFGSPNASSSQSGPVATEPKQQEAIHESLKTEGLTF